MEDRVERLKTYKDAQILAANADRLGNPALAESARERGEELKLAERKDRRKKLKNDGSRKAGAQKVKERAEGESLFLNGVFEQVLNEIERAQQADPDLICYLQPYKPILIRRLKELQPDLTSPWKLYLSVTDSLAVVSFEAEVVVWRDKAKLTADEIAGLNRHFVSHQPGERGVHLSDAGREAGSNLLGIVRLRRIDPPLFVSAFKKLSDDLPLKERTRAGGWSYVISPESPGDFELISQAIWEKSAAKEATRAKKRNSAERRDRLRHADPVPQQKYVVVKAFRRNPDVVQEVLERAKGFCEDCRSPAPFARASDGTPYLEVHHKVMLFLGGLDNVENAIALCPNCHRKRHFAAVEPEIS